MQVDELLNKGLNLEFLTAEEGLFLYEKASTAELMFIGNSIRQFHVPTDTVTWMIDRNANTTNVCVANCKFCNFFRRPGHEESYVTSIEEYKIKIDETFALGGEQLLLQGGHHPELGLEYYVKLFSELKSLYPNLKLHALGPPEIAHISKLDGLSFHTVLSELMKAGLDSLPGAGAEILSDRVRRLVSKGKCNAQQWLDVMRVAHQLGLATSATMMYGHVETTLERLEHLVALRQVQAEKPNDAMGFLAYICWPFQDYGTLLKKLNRATNKSTGDEYLRMVAISRIMLPNIKNVQASWLTVGKKVGQAALFAGANDMGSIMIEENVVSAAGAQHRFTSSGIQQAILEAGFKPQLRDQLYNNRVLPENIIQQSLSQSAYTYN